MPRKRVVIPDDVKEQMRRDAKRLPYNKIANIYGVSLNKAFETIKGIRPIGRPNKKDDVEYKAICEDYLNGLGVGKITKKYNCSTYKVYHVLSVLDKSPRKNYERVKEIKEDIKKGELTQSEIAKKHGVSRQRVSKIKKEMVDKNENLAL